MGMFSDFFNNKIERPAMKSSHEPAEGLLAAEAPEHAFDVVKASHNMSELDVIKSDEGYREEAYWDDIGKTWTIGYGTTKGVKKGDVITEEEAEARLREDFDNAAKDAQSLVDNFTELDREKQGVLINMAYNMGKPTLKKFKKMIKAVEKEDFEEAAVQMKKSLWYKQVGNRADRLIDRMRA